MKDLKTLLRTTPKYIAILANHGIHSVKDFLEYFPRDYQDRTKLTPLSELFFTDPERGVVTAQVKIIHKKPVQRGPKRFREIKFRDVEGNEGYALFSYRTAYLISEVKKDSRFLVIGKVQIKGNRLTFRYPEIIASADPTAKHIELEDSQTGRIYPIYSEMMNIKPAWFAKKMFLLKDSITDYIHEYLPPKFLKLFQLMDVPTTIKQMHFPDSFQLQKKAEHRVMFDRLLRIQLYSELFKRDYQNNITSTENLDTLVVKKINTKQEEIKQAKLFGDEDAKQQETRKPKKKTKRESPSKSSEESKREENNTHNEKTYENEGIYSSNPNRGRVSEYTSQLPFELTGAQKRIIKEMIEDIHREKPMMRLLQGDVGSGKTVVVTAVAYYIIKEFGKQIAFIAPLAILAHQHYIGLSKLLLPLGIRTEFIAGSVTKSQKDIIKKNLAHGTIDLIVGTHALIQDDVYFHDLGLAIVDEQHKFGVKQRAFFKHAGSPHIIQMSATPIPRSLALAFFGEFDVSIIDEMPAGRKPIVTKIVRETQFTKLKQRFLAKLNEGQKLFVVTPLIEESEKLENVKDATSEWEKICDMFPEMKGKIGLLHGRMKPGQKDDVMKAFKEGKFMILVATTVIEVGVDIPEATMMLITNAERFGLAQLHQLRGRIGRNDIQSYCFLETKSPSERLRVMEKFTDGFKLAELDLQFRGSGQILGTRQSGETDIPYEYLTNIDFLQSTKKGAQRLLENYPHLDGLPGLIEQLEVRVGNMMI